MNNILNILLVEDNEGDFLLVKEYLKDAFGHVEINHSNRLSEAKNCLIKSTFDIVLFDLTLPDSDGMGSVREIMEMANEIPVIVLTGYSDKNFAFDTLQYGVQDYLVKDEVNATILQKCISYSIERNKIQKLFLRNEKKFRSIIENSIDEYALIEPNGKVLELSPFGKRKININPIDSNGYFNIKLINPSDRKQAIHTFLEVSKHPNDIRIIELKCKLSENEYRWIESTIYNLLDEPSVGAIVLNYRDITLRKNEESNRKLLIEELIQSNASLKQFGFITSHNLRAPLTNLLSIVDLLDINRIQDNTTKELIDAFKSATFQLNDTLNDLIKVLFIKQNTNIAIYHIYFNSIIEKIVHNLQVLINNSDIRIDFDFSEAPSIYFDENYLENILLNLMSNSIKFASPERKLKIMMKSTIEGEFTVLEFSDNGIGMDMERVKDRIFGLYQKFHDYSDGKGIGLYLIHSQLTALGAKITVSSKVNVGTTFYITFKNKQETVF